MASGIDFGAGLTREQQGAIDKQYTEKRRNERLGTTEKGKEKDTIDVAKLPGGKTQGQQPFVPGKHTEQFLKNAPPPPPKQADVEKELKEKARLLRIYAAYYESDETCPYLPKRMELSVRNSLAEIKVTLDNVRAALNGANADGTIRKMYPTLVELIVKALEHLGLLETLGLTGAQGVGNALQQAMDTPMLQTEMTEMSIELQDWFSASWQTRIMIKTYIFTKAYASAQTARMRPAPSMSAAAAADLGVPEDQK